MGFSHKNQCPGSRSDFPAPRSRTCLPYSFCNLFLFLYCAVRTFSFIPCLTFMLLPFRLSLSLPSPNVFFTFSSSLNFPFPAPPLLHSRPLHGTGCLLLVKPPLLIIRPTPPIQPVSVTCLFAPGRAGVEANIGGNSPTLKYFQPKLGNQIGKSRDFSEIHIVIYPITRSFYDNNFYAARFFTTRIRRVVSVPSVSLFSRRPVGPF